MFRAQNHITLDLIKIPLNKQTEVAFSLKYISFKGISKVHMNLLIFRHLNGSTSLNAPRGLQ